MSDFYKVYSIKNSDTVGDEVNIMLTGDLLCQNLLLQGKKVNNEDHKYEFNSSFSKMKRALSTSDLVVSGLDLKGKEIPEEYFNSLKRNNFNVLLPKYDSQYYTSEMDKMLQYCRKEELLYPDNYKKENKCSSMMFDVNGVKIGILNCTIINNYISFSDIEREINSMKMNRSDFIIGYVHWNDNYKTKVDGRQRAIAIALAEMGIDYIVGGGTNTIQKHEIIEVSWGRKVPVVYSLGIFLNCSNFLNRATTAILNIRIIKDSGGEYRLKIVICLVLHLLF